MVGGYDILTDLYLPLEYQKCMIKPQLCSVQLHIKYGSVLDLQEY